MATTVEVTPEVVTWARERTQHDPESLVKRFPHLPEWEQGTRKPTWSQLEKFAKATYTSVGVFFRDEPPLDVLPITDFRTVGNLGVRRPSPDLLETIRDCQRRLEWYRDYAIANEFPKIEFVASLSIEMKVPVAAENLRSLLGPINQMWRPVSNFDDQVSGLREACESAGILIMINGIVGSNTHRKLDPNEFRGFVLVDEFAPIVFVNGSDAKAAQVFTIIHELVHLGLGVSGVSDVSLIPIGSKPTEEWVNRVTAEVLVPESEITQRWSHSQTADLEAKRLAPHFHVSAEVVLRKAIDTGLIDEEEYWIARDVLQTTTVQNRSAGDGGNFYNSQLVRVGHRLTRAILLDTLEGNTSYKDAFRLMGFSSQKAFDGLVKKLGLQ